MGWLFTCVHYLFSLTFLASDSAAPEETALAVFSYDHFSHACITLAAKQLTAPHPHASVVALPAHSSMGAQIRVLFAEVWGLGGVHQIEFCWLLYCLSFLNQPVAFVVNYHFNGTIETGF